MLQLTTNHVFQKSWTVLAIALLLGSLSAAQEIPKEEVYLGYSFLRVNSAVSVPAFTANGGLGSFQYNFNKNISLLGEFGGHHNGNISGAELDSTLFSYLFGPRLFVHKEHRVSPFVETLFGGMHYTRSFSPELAVNPLATVTSGDRIKNSQDAFAMAVGGGLDIRINRSVAFRPIQLDYVLTRFQPLFIAGLGEINRDRNQNNLRYSTGLAFRFGAPAPTAPSASCSGEPSEVLPDDPPVTVTVQTVNFNPKHALTHQWESNGGHVIGDGTSAKIDVTGLDAGTYQVTSKVTDPKQKQNNVAACTAAFTVKQPQAPVVACAASPSRIVAGSSTPVSITAHGSTPDPRPISSRKFTTSAGSIQEGRTSSGGSGEWSSIAMLETSGVEAGKIDVNIDVKDSRGLAANCVAQVEVDPAPAAPLAAAPVAQTQVGQCEFNNAKDPSRVDNTCKAALDGTASRLQHDANGRLVLVGSADADEQSKQAQFGAIRALKAKNYLTSGEGHQGIDPARLEIRQDAGGSKTVVLYWVPAGGNFTAENTTAVDEEQIKALVAAPAKKKGKQPATTAAALP